MTGFEAAGMTFAGAMLVALVIDAVAGWPASLHARVGHPVTWLGGLIGWLDRSWNIETSTSWRRRMLGVLAASFVVAVAVLPTYFLQSALPGGWFGTVLIGVLAWPLLAVRSLYDHVAAVGTPLARGEVEDARAQLAMIVGRDVTVLDEAGIARAGLESLAENASDGVVAPLFWGLVFGLPGIAAYKAINTLDSMIGYRTERHEEFGWASARLDDIANFIPARLTGAILALVSGRMRPAIGGMLEDAHRHRSPNAGWPEAAMAGALGVRLSGPRVYQDKVVDEPWLNGGARDPDGDDVARGLMLYRTGMIALGLLLAGMAALPVVLS